MWTLQIVVTVGEPADLYFLSLVSNEERVSIVLYSTIQDVEAQIVAGD